MKINMLCSVLFCLAIQCVNAQTTQTETVVSNPFEAPRKSQGIIFGVHGARETMVEIGYYILKFKEEGYGDVAKGFSIATEHYINSDYIIAPKIAALANVWEIQMGVGALWYFDMEKNNSIRLRPEIGYGSKKYKITYAFNMALTNKDMTNISKHMLSFSYFFNLTKKRKP